MRNTTILVADSDRAVAACIAEALTFEGYTVHCHPGDRLTGEIIKQMRSDLVIMEQWRACADVTLLLSQLEQCGAATPPAVIVSTTDSHMLHDLATPLQLYGCTTLLKPFDLDQLLDSVAAALDGRSGRPAALLEQRYA